MGAAPTRSSPATSTRKAPGAGSGAPGLEESWTCRHGAHPLLLPLHLVPPCRRVSRAGGALVVHARAAASGRRARPRSSTSSAIPGSPRSSRRKRAPRSRMSTPRRRRSPGRARTRRCPSLDDKPIRWILDDAPKFAAREVRRGRRYDGILLDPPKFGRGPKGEVWDLFREPARDAAALPRAAEARRLPDPHRLRDPRLVPVAAPAVGGGARAGRGIGRAGARRTQGGGLLATSLFSRWTAP